MGRIYYCCLDALWTKEQIFQFFREKQLVYALDLREVIPNGEQLEDVAYPTRCYT